MLLKHGKQSAYFAVDCTVEQIRGVSLQQRKPWPSSESHNVMIERFSIPVRPSASHPRPWVHCGLRIGLFRGFRSLRRPLPAQPTHSYFLLGIWNGQVRCLVVCRVELSLPTASLSEPRATPNTGIAPRKREDGPLLTRAVSGHIEKVRVARSCCCCAVVVSKSSGKGRESIKL